MDQRARKFTIPERRACGWYLRWVWRMSHVAT